MGKYEDNSVLKKAEKLMIFSVDDNQEDYFRLKIVSDGKLLMQLLNPFPVVKEWPVVSLLKKVSLIFDIHFLTRNEIVLKEKEHTMKDKRSIVNLLLSSSFFFFFPVLLSILSCTCVVPPFLFCYLVLNMLHYCQVNRYLYYMDVPSVVVSSFLF